MNPYNLLWNALGKSRLFVQEIEFLRKNLNMTQNYGQLLRYSHFETWNARLLAPGLDKDK